MGGHGEQTAICRASHGVEMVGKMVLVALPAPIAAGRAAITVEKARTAGRAAILYAGNGGGWRGWGRNLK